MDSRIRAASEVLWQFLGQGAAEPAGGGNLGILCGSRDLFVAEHAAKLYEQGHLFAIICSGGVAHADDLLATGWDRSEASIFADALERLGVPPSAILLEERATNTAENIRFSLDVAKGLDRPDAPLVFLHKPFMVLRTALTAAAIVPGRDVVTSAPAMSLEAYLARVDDPDRTITIMVGDFERIFAYALKGFLAPVDIPAETLTAARLLREAGYDSHSIIR